jgi:hypothetical protein
MSILVTNSPFLVLVVIPWPFSSMTLVEMLPFPVLEKPIMLCVDDLWQTFLVSSSIFESACPFHPMSISLPEGLQIIAS